MTLETKVRTMLTASALVAMIAVFTAYGFRQDDPYLVQTVAVVGAGALIGLLTGVYRRRDRPQPGAHDVEASWIQRAQAGAFLDAATVTFPALFTVGIVTHWGRSLPSVALLTVVIVTGVLDTAVRYWLIRRREQG